MPRVHITSKQANFIMEILLEGKNKAYSKLPAWFEYAVKELCSKPSHHVLVVYRLKDKPTGSYDVYNHRSKTILRILKRKSYILLESMKQRVPEHNAIHTPTWDIVNSRKLVLDPNHPPSFFTICETIVGLVLRDVCATTPYCYSPEANFSKSMVGSYPTQEHPLYGGRIASSQLQNDFYQVTLDNANQHYIPKHLGEKLQLQPGSFLVMKNNQFNVVNAGVFFDYFSLH